MGVRRQCERPDMRLRHVVAGARLQHRVGIAGVAEVFEAIVALVLRQASVRQPVPGCAAAHAQQAADAAQSRVQRVRDGLPAGGGSPAPKDPTFATQQNTGWCPVPDFQGPM